MRISFFVLLLALLGAAVHANEPATGQIADLEATSMMSPAVLCGDLDGTGVQSCKLPEAELGEGQTLLGELTRFAQALPPPDCDQESCNLQCSPTGGMCTTLGCACF